ncbi:MAG: DUF5997 family protein [Actinomycetota bacterium]|nr:DUF5997 family protein [Actinomycetota bacterium]
MTAGKKQQTMKPLTAATKLEIYLPATPEAFQHAPLSRTELAALRESPPEWLVTLRREGPHPRPVVARKLGISNSGLARGGVGEALTTSAINRLLARPPEWLVAERKTQAEVRAQTR